MKPSLHGCILTQARAWSRIGRFGLFGIYLALAACGGGGSSSGSSSSTPAPSRSVMVSVSPMSANVLLGTTQQFTATVSGSTNTAVTWSVDSIAGGDSSVGTINSAGLYTAPADLPSPASVTVTAASQASSAASATSMVSVASDIQVAAQASVSSVDTTGAVHLTAAVTSSGHPNNAVTWSVDGVTNGNATVGTITSTGADTATYTAPGSVPKPSSVTIQATSVADTARSGSTSVSVMAPTQLRISAMSSMSAKPFDLLTVDGSGIQDGTQALSVLFTPENGDAPIMVPVSKSNAGSVTAMVPVFANSSGAFVPETVDVQLVAFSASTVYISNVITGIQVSGLPTPDSSASLGARTAALLAAVQNIIGTEESAQSGNTTFQEMLAALKQSNGDISAMISAVKTLQKNPNDSVAVDEANGGTAALNAQMLGRADALAEAIVKAMVSDTSIPVGSASSGCPVTGDKVYDADLCGVQTYFETLVSQSTAVKHLRLRSVRTSRKALSPADAATLNFFTNLTLAGVAEVLEPAGGGFIYESVLAPIVTSTITSFAVYGEAPTGTRLTAEVLLKNVDIDVFDGIPVASVTVSGAETVLQIVAPSAWESGVALSSGAASAVSKQPGQIGELVEDDPNTGQPDSLLLVPPDTSGGSFDSTALVEPPPSTPFMLTVAVGSGQGSLQSFPTGIECGAGATAGCSASFPAGQVVEITAQPAAGQSLTGWSGACSGNGACVVSMNSDQSATATFSAGQTYVGYFSAPFKGTFPDPDGDTYSATISGTITLSLVPGSGGAFSGSATVAANIGIAVASCPVGNCTVTPFSESASGSPSGTIQSFTVNFSNQNTFSLTLSGGQSSTGTITGNITFSALFVGTSGGSSINTTLSGSDSSVTLNAQ